MIDFTYQLQTKKINNNKKLFYIIDFFEIIPEEKCRFATSLKF